MISNPATARQRGCAFGQLRMHLRGCTAECHFGTQDMGESRKTTIACSLRARYRQPGGRKLHTYSWQQACEISDGAPDGAPEPLVVFAAQFEQALSPQNTLCFMRCAARAHSCFSVASRQPHLTPASTPAPRAAPRHPAGCACCCAHCCQCCCCWLLLKEAQHPQEDIQAPEARSC